MTVPLPMSDGLYISPQRPHRDRIRFFVKYYPFIVGSLVSAIILVSIAPSSLLLAGLSIGAYWVYVSIKLWHRRRQAWANYYRSVWAQFVRALLLVAGITVVLYYLYNHTVYLRSVSGNDTMWLLYLLAVYIMSQRGSTSHLTLTIVAAVAALFLVEPVAGIALAYVPGWKPVTLSFIAKVGWLVLLSLILYIFLRYMGDIIADLNLIIGVQGRLRVFEETLVSSPSQPDVRGYLEKAVEVIREDSSYDNVNVFRLRDDRKSLECVAAACKQGKQLVDEGFILTIDREESIIGHVIQTGASYLTNNVRADPYYLAHAAFPKTHAELAVPIRTRNRLYGALDIQADHRDYFLDQDLPSMQILANHIGWMIDSFEQFDHLNWINRIVENIAAPIFTQADLEQTLQEIADTAHHELDADPVVLWSYDPKTAHKPMGPIYAGHLAYPEIVAVTEITSDNIIYKLLSMGDEIYLFEDLARIDLSTHPIFRPSSFHRSTGRPSFVAREGICAVAIIRLLNGVECVGLLFLNFREPRSFSESDQRRYFSFAHLAALAIQKMQVYQRMLQWEMTDLAHRVHDGLIGDTIGLHKVLDAIQLPATEAGWQKCQEYLNLAKSMTDQLHNDIRYIERLLTADCSDNLLIEIDRLSLLFQQIFRVQIQSTFRGDIQEIPPERAQALRFVIRESVTNAVRHGKAKLIQVSVSITDGYVGLSIQDDGSGFALGQVRRKNGLQGMQERVCRLGGVFNVKSKPGQGTLIEVSLPF